MILVFLRSQHIYKKQFVKNQQIPQLISRTAVFIFKLKKLNFSGILI